MTNSFKINSILFIFIFALSISCSKTIIPGRYCTNFATYGMFGKTLKLNRDSTVIINFAGDLMNDNSYGNWKINNDTLLITFDTIKYPNSRYKKDLAYKIKGNRLYNIAFTNEQYQDFLLKAKNEGYDIKGMPNASRFNRIADKNMTNHKGTMRRQFFKRKEIYN